MAISKNGKVADLTGEFKGLGNNLTYLKVDYDVNITTSYEAVALAHATVSKYANIVAAGAIYDSGTQQHFILEGDQAGSTYVSEDGTVTGTIAAAIVEDLINIGSFTDTAGVTVNFAAGTTAASVVSTLQFA